MANEETDVAPATEDQSIGGSDLRAQRRAAVSGAYQTAGRYADPAPEVVDIPVNVTEEPEA